jgi:DNA polymerase III alpha subunit
MEPPSVTELLEMCPPNDPAWDVYAKGATIGINQVEKTGTTARVAKYHPTNISELCAFVAAIRPGFASMYKTFESRQPFKYGVKSFDELIQTEEMPNSFVLYQEMEMAALHYAGIPMSECYTAIKNIAKKRVEKVLAYKGTFISGFANAIMRDEGKPEDAAKELAGELWTIIEDSSRYSFNACVSGDTIIRQWNTRMETVETMYNAMHNNTHYLHEVYARHGYGYGYSLAPMGLYKNRIVDIRFAGVQRLYKVTLENGEGTYIKCTENHKFPTPYGIKELSELSVGDELYWMSNEMIYQIKIDRIAPQALRKKIISIEDFGEAPTYDVEMAEPDHNFATETGIITSNSHSYCVSLDSLYGAWLKAHHPVEFYEVFINQMEEKGDKDRAQDAKREAEEYFGIKFLPYRYGQDNRAPIADVEKRIITKSLTSVKGFGKTLARELYQCSKNDFKYFVDVLKWLDERSIKEAKVTPLIQIDYFQQFGNSAELSRIMRMFDFFKQGTMKTIRKEKLVGSELEHIVARHATDRNVKNEELKTYTITDITAILHECEDYIKSLNISEINLKVKMQNQLDILGYIDIKTGVPEDRRKLIVTDLVPLKSKASGDVWGYACFTRSVGTGKNARLTIRTATYNRNKISKGDIIYASDVQKNQSGYWYLIKYERVE